jgi:hypothetical protein
VALGKGLGEGLARSSCATTATSDDTSDVCEAFAMAPNQSLIRALFRSMSDELGH